MPRQRSVRNPTPHVHGSTTCVMKPIHEMIDEEVDALMMPEQRAESEAVLKDLEDGTAVSILTPEEYERHRAIAQNTLDMLARTEERGMSRGPR